MRIDQKSAVVRHLKVVCALLLEVVLIPSRSLCCIRPLSVLLKTQSILKCFRHEKRPLFPGMHFVLRRGECQGTTAFCKSQTYFERFGDEARSTL